MSKSVKLIAASQNTETGDILWSFELRYWRALHAERQQLSHNDQLRVSAARAARVSYAPFDGNADVAKEVERHDKLVGSVPMHASPTEHQAEAVAAESWWVETANFKGFKQYRADLEDRVRP